MILVNSEHISQTKPEEKIIVQKKLIKWDILCMIFQISTLLFFS